MGIKNVKFFLVQIVLFQVCFSIDFINYTNKNGIQEIAIHNDTVWVATYEGVAKLDINGVVLKEYVTADGLLNNWVNCLAIDSTGNKWFGVSGGISKFDGVKWTTFTTNDGIICDNPRVITVDKDNNIWVGYEEYGAGVNKFNDTTWKTYTEADGLANNSVSAISIDHDGMIWFGAGVYACYYDGFTWGAEKINWQIYSIAVDKNGHKWFGTRSDIFMFDGQTWTEHKPPNSSHNRFYTVAVDDNNNKWFGWFFGIVKLHDTTWTQYNNFGMVQSIAIDSKGNKWIDGKSLRKFDDNNLTSFQIGMKGSWIQSILIDSDGTTWFGSYNSGVSTFDGKTWSHYNEEFPGERVSSICEDNEGNLWFGTDLGVSKFDGSTWFSYSETNGLVSNKVSVVLCDLDGNKWFGTDKGVSKFDDTSWTTYNTSDGLVYHKIYSMAIDNQNNKWFGTGGGVSKFNDTNWITYQVQDGLANNYVYDIYIDNQNNKWIGTGGGVSKFNDTNWTTYRVQDGLATNSVRKTIVDNIGNKWFLCGYYNAISGLTKYNDSTWTTYSTNDGLVDNFLTTMAVDNFGGKMWIGTRYGVSMFYDEAFYLDHDISINKILSPKPITNFNDNVIPKVLIRNNGKNDETFSTILTIQGEYADTVTKVLKSLEQDSVAFKEWEDKKIGTFSLKCSTLVADDQWSKNNVKNMTLVIRESKIPIVYSISPDKGANIEEVDVTITGINFSENVKVFLRMSGQNNIVADPDSVVVNNLGTVIKAKIDISGKVIGKWDVVVENSDGEQGALQTGFTIEQGNTLSITSISPDRAPNTGKIAVSIKGTFFQKGIKVSLLKTGEPIISADSTLTSVDSLGTTISTTLDITGQTIGLWDLKVKNPNNDSALLTKAFTIIEDSTPSITSISPNSVINNGNATITIHGSSFFKGAIAVLKKDSASDIIADTTQITISNQGKMITAIFNVTGQPVGQWDVVVRNSNGKEDILEKALIIVSGTNPEIISISPDKGGNTGVVTAIISGANFREGLNVILKKKGMPDIVIDSSTIRVDSTGKYIALTIDCKDKPLGQWDLVVRNPDGKETTFYNGFTIVEGHEKLWVDLAGREQVRVGREADYLVIIGNSGSINSEDLFVSFQIPDDFTLIQIKTSKGKIIWARDSILKEIEEGKLLYPTEWAMISDAQINEYINKSPVFNIPRIDAGQTIDLHLTLKANNPSKRSALTLGVIIVHLGKEILKSAAISFAVHLTSQVVYYSNDPIDDLPGEALWKSLKYSFWETLNGLNPFKEEPVFLMRDQCQDWLEKILTIDNHGVSDFTKLLIRLGYNSDKAISLGKRLLDAAHKHGLTLKKLKVFKFTTKAIDAVLKIFEKAMRARNEWGAYYLIREKDVEAINSMDPNDKSGPAGFGPSGYTAGDHPFHYTIYFENVDTATASAEDIIIIDSLDKNLDWSTFTSDTSSHPITTVTFDSTNGVLTWLFEDINLPPNKIPPEGEGWLRFSLSPKPGLPTGTQIKNRAWITFDINKPMATSEVLNTIDVGAPESKIRTLPAIQTSTEFTVPLSGQDDPGGSGIRNYSIYVSDNDSAYSLWTTIDKPMFTFSGKNNHEYKFYSLAVDNISNLEKIPSSHDAITIVKVPSGVAVSPNPFVPSRGHKEISFFGDGVPFSEIRVFNKANELVQTIHDQKGMSRLDWDGRSKDGRTLASGVYIYIAKEKSGKIRKGKLSIIR